MRLFDHRIDVFNHTGEHKNAGIGLKAKAGIVAQMGSIDAQGTGEIVAHKKIAPPPSLAELAVIEYFGSFRHCDSDRVRAAVKDDYTAGSHRPD